MQKVLLAIVVFLSAQTAWAVDNEIKVSTCSKNAEAQLVELRGSTALEMYLFIAKELDQDPAYLGETQTHGMRCTPLYEKGKLTSAGCSYLMYKGQNIPFPQLDSGFSGQPVVQCN